VKKSHKTTCLFSWITDRLTFTIYPALTAVFAGFQYALPRIFSLKKKQQNTKWLMEQMPTVLFG
jgi:hypothetical protein